MARKHRSPDAILPDTACRRDDALLFAASLLRPTARLHVDSMFDLSSLYRQLWAEARHEQSAQACIELSTAQRGA